MNIGTKSILYGAHCFFIHPFFVAIAWNRLYGFPLDPRLWIAFFVHDIGYWGKPNMDGPEGETHVELGANIMHFLFDWKIVYWKQLFAHGPYIREVVPKWRNFSLYHSRYYAKKDEAMPSKLCFADKLSFVCTPRWLYLPMVNTTGEIEEYLKMAKKTETKHWQPVEGQKVWHAQLCKFMLKWVAEHRYGNVDTWTNSDRHAITESGVWG
jgi:hypothetical protein